MTRFSVKLKNILGLSYYRYELTSSNYNPTVSATNENTYTITCKVTDIFGNNISGKQLTLYKNGSSVSNATTDSNGVATWTEYSTGWGTIDYNVSNQHCYVNARGFKLFKDTMSNHRYILYANNQTRTMQLKATFNNDSIATGEQWKQTEYVGEGYRPQGQVLMSLRRLGGLELVVGTNGDIYVYNNSGGTISNFTQTVVMSWNY